VSVFFDALLELEKPDEPVALVDGDHLRPHLFGREYPLQGGGATTVIADTRDGGLPNPSSGKIFSAGPSLVLASYSWD
jgi:hypothetical protein